jgi:hypothetical protein
MYNSEMCYICLICDDNEYIRWVDTFVAGLLVSESIIRPEVNISVLTWFIRTKVHLPRA